MSDPKEYKVEKQEGCKMFSYNYTNGIVTPKSCLEFPGVTEDGRKVIVAVFKNDANSISLQAHNVHHAKEKMKKFLKERSKNAKMDRNKVSVS